MGKIMTDAMIDGGLTKRGTTTTQSVCSAEPTSYANIAAVTLASVGSLTHTPANGDSSGRKSTVSQKTGVSITSSGTATHVVLDDGTDYEVTTCTSQALTSGGTVTIPAWKREIADPT